MTSVSAAIVTALPAIVIGVPRELYWPALITITSPSTAESIAACSSACPGPPSGSTTITPARAAPTEEKPKASRTDSPIDARIVSPPQLRGDAAILALHGNPCCAARAVVRPAGVEPATPGLGNQCSIHLSLIHISEPT